MGDTLPRYPGRIPDDARREGVATVLLGCGCNPRLICHCKPPRSDEETPPEAQEPIRVDYPSSGGDGSRRAEAARDPFEDLPPELLPTILSNLDVKQAARTSVLSSAWRHAWKHSPKLSLDIVAICGVGYMSRKPGEDQYRAFVERGRYVQRFIDSVGTILRQRRGSVVEQLELRFDESHLRHVSGHLDAWIRFAVSSQAKSVRLHVSESPLAVYVPRYEFLLQLLDAGGGVSILRHIHLSSVSLKLPSSPTQSITGFPNLKSLGLCSATVSTSDLQHMLSNCPILERLDVYMVYLDDELRLHRPLPRLQYLRLVDCRVTKIELDADKLTTFIFRGRSPPTLINHGETSRLHNVNLQCYKLTLQQSVSSLANSFPAVRRLSLCGTIILPTLSSQLENIPRFSHLRYLQLGFCIYPFEHSHGILSIAYFLESAPLLEELDIKFVSICKNGGEGPLRSLPHGRFEYKRLSSLRAREFSGQKDQVELIIHIVENAPSLESLTIDPITHHVPSNIDQVADSKTRSLSEILNRATTLISEKLLAKTKFIVV